MMKLSKHPAIVLAALSALVLPAILLYPFNMDNDILQAMGLELYRQHGLPYLASWDQNFPGIVFIHAFAISIFGNGIFEFHLLEYIWQVAVLLVLYKVSRLWLSEASSLLGCTFYSLYYVYGPLMLMGQRDGFAALPILGGVFFIVQAYRGDNKRGSSMFIFAAGVLYAIAVSIRPTYILLLPAPLLTLWSIRRRESKKMLTQYLGGFALVVLIFLIPYALQSGGLREAYLATVRYNLDVYSQMPAELISGRTFFIAALLVLWAGFVIYHKSAGIRFAESPSSRPERRFLTLTVICILLGVIVMRKFLSYHYIPFFVVAMPALASVTMEWTKKTGRWQRPLLALLVCVLFIGLYPWNMARQFVGSGFSLSAPYRAMLPDSLTGIEAQEQVAEYVNSRTNPNDVVEFASYFPGPRWRIDRAEATRFTSLMPLLPHTPEGNYTSYQKAWQKEFVSRLYAVQPEYIIIQEIPDPEHTTSERFAPVFKRIIEFAGMRELLSEKYHLDTTLGSCKLYKRNS